MVAHTTQTTVRDTLWLVASECTTFAHAHRFIRITLVLRDPPCNHRSDTSDTQSDIDVIVATVSPSASTAHHSNASIHSGKQPKYIERW